MKREIEQFDYCYWENQLHEGIEELIDAKDKIRNSYINLIKICMERGHYKIDVPYEYCAFCTCKLKNTNNNITYRIVGIDMSDESTIDPVLILQDKEIFNATDKDKVSVNINDTDFDQAHLAQIIIDYIVNWQ